MVFIVLDWADINVLLYMDFKFLDWVDINIYIVYGFYCFRLGGYKSLCCIWVLNI